MLKDLRRIVTEVNKDGNSVISMNGPPGNIFEMDGKEIVGEIWKARASAPDLHAPSDPVLGEIRLEPDKGGALFRYFVVAPEPVNSSLEQKAALQDQYDSTFASVEGADRFQVKGARHPAMHKTDTIDFIVVIRGEVTLLVGEDDDVNLKQGDSVVQCATDHAWVNYGSEPALLMAVLIDAGNPG